MKQILLVRFVGLGVLSKVCRFRDDWPGLLGLVYLILFDGLGFLYRGSLSGFGWSDLLGGVCRVGLICEGSKNKFG